MIQKKFKTLNIRLKPREENKRKAKRKWTKKKLRRTTKKKKKNSRRKQRKKLMFQRGEDVFIFLMIILEVKLNLL
jgi:hypothetical protein